MAKQASLMGTEQHIADMAVKLRDAIETAQRAGYRVMMPFSLDHLDSISVSATAASESRAAGREPSKANEVQKDGTLKPVEGEPLAKGGA